MSSLQGLAPVESVAFVGAMHPRFQERLDRVSDDASDPADVLRNALVDVLLMELVAHADRLASEGMPDIAA